MDKYKPDLILSAHDHEVRIKALLPICNVCRFQTNLYMTQRDSSSTNRIDIERRRRFQLSPQHPVVEFQTPTVVSNHRARHLSHCFNELVVTLELSDGRPQNGLRGRRTYAEQYRR